jgi:hypothetical protein
MSKPKMSALISIDNNVWIDHMDSKLMGLNFGAKMTVINTEIGLVLYSPIKMTKSLLNDVNNCGNVSSIIAPNPYHHLFLSAWIETFPTALLYGPKKLAKKRGDLHFSHLFFPGDILNLPMGLDSTILGGRNDMAELLLYHGPSKTLIAADLLFNIEAHNGLQKLIRKLCGIKNYPSSSKPFRYFYPVTDTFKTSIKHILSYDVERVIMAYGRVLEYEAKKALRTALDWAL